jgi:integral membrane sensor domain MASE1
MVTQDSMLDVVGGLLFATATTSSRQQKLLNKSPNKFFADYMVCCFGIFLIVILQGFQCEHLPLLYVQFLEVVVASFRFTSCFGVNYAIIDK